MLLIQTMVLRHLITARQAHFIRTRQPFDQNRRRSYEKAVFSHRCPLALSLTLTACGKQEQTTTPDDDNSGVPAQTEPYLIGISQ